MPEKRRRDCAHLWADKQVLRFLRKNFERIDYKKLRAVYLGLCEIDSDFTEERDNRNNNILHSLTKTCSTYTGMDANGVSQAMQALKILELIDYGRKTDENNRRIIGSYLIMYKWEDCEKSIKSLIREDNNKGESYRIKNLLTERLNKDDSKESEKELSSKEDKSKPAVCNSSSERSLLDVSPKETPEKEFLEEASPVAEKSWNEPAKYKHPVKVNNNRPAKDDDILPGQRTIKGRLPYENASPEAREVIDAWNKLETTPVHKNTSKAIQGVCRLLDDKLLKKYDVEDILRTMRDFSDMQKDARTYKVSTKKLNIMDFFSNNGYVTGMMHRQGRHMEPPWFDRLILSGSFIKYRRRQDPHPEYTTEFKRIYERRILVEKNVVYTPTQEDKFIAASAQLAEYMKKERLEKYIDGANWKDYILYFFKALADQYDSTRVIVGHLCSVNSWNNVFPRYLSRHWET